MKLADAFAQAVEAAKASGPRDPREDLPFSVSGDYGRADFRALVGKCSCVNAGPVGTAAATTLMLNGFSTKVEDGTRVTCLNYVYRPTGWNTMVVHGVSYRLRGPDGETPYPETDLPDLG